MDLISSICILGATIGVISILLLFFLRKQQEKQNEKLRIFLEKMNQQQTVYLEKFIAEQHLFEAEQIEKVKEWLIGKDFVENEY